MKNFYLGITDNNENLRVREFLKEYSNSTNHCVKVRGIDKINNKIDVCILDMQNYLYYKKQLLAYPDIKIIILNNDIKNLIYYQNIYMISFPIQQEQLNILLNRIYNRIKEENIFIPIANKGEVKINIEIINYIDIFKRSLNYHLIAAEPIIGKTMRSSFAVEVEPYLIHEEFCFIKPSIIINVCNIKELYPEYIVFQSGEKLYYPKTAYKNLYTKWKEFYEQ